MKNINSIILIVLCIFTLFLSFGSSVLAQPAIPSLSKPSSIILNSQPEIYVKNIVLDSKTYKAGDTVKGSFTLLNNKAQPVSDVYYKISLAGDYQKNNLAKTFYDSIKNGPFSLAGRESKKIDFTYVLPNAVAGDNLGIQVSALLGSGMPMGWGDSMIKVEGEMSLLKVSKVVISIGDNKFDFQTGTAVSREDEAFLEVSLANPTKNKIEIIPKVKIYNNITPAISSELNLNTITIPANSSSSIKYELPKFENKVGVYVGNLSFSDANGNKRALDLQFNYRIPELNNVTNTDVSQNGISTGKVYTTMDYVFFVGLILLGLGLIGLIVFIVIKFKNKIPFSLFIILFIFSLMTMGVEKVEAQTLTKCGNDYYYSSGSYMYKRVGSATGTSYLLGSGIDPITCVGPDAYFLRRISPDYVMKSLGGSSASASHLGLGSSPIVGCGSDAYFENSDGYVTKVIAGGLNRYTVDGSRFSVQCISSDAYFPTGSAGYFFKSIGGVASATYMGVGQMSKLRACPDNAGEWLTSYNFKKSNLGSTDIDDYSFLRTCYGVISSSTYALTINKDGNGSGTVTGAGTYNSGYTVTATAIPNAGSTFTGWSTDCNTSGQVTMTSAKTCTATFVLSTYVITFDGNTNTGGTMPTQSIQFGSSANLISNAFTKTGYTFGGWSTSPSGVVDYDNRASYTMGGANVTLYAKWNPLPTYTLTVNINGIGSGIVTSDVGGISCGATCSATYTSGTNVTLTAYPSTGSAFTGWSGACTGTGTCLVTMTSVKSLTATFTPTFSGGDGSIANPYRISACTELQAVKNYLTSNFILIKDIDCSDTVNWNGGAGFEPIGRYNSITPGAYKGNFNGAGFKIINLTINRPLTDSVGLFSWIYGVTISNVGLVNANISGSGIVGALVAFSNGTIIDSYSSGSVISAGWFSGGLVGSAGAHSIITNCSSASSVRGDWYVGGLIGWGGTSISNSFSSGSVTGNNNVGGLVGGGGATDTSIKDNLSNSYATGNITGNTNVGGLVGASSNFAITNSYSSGSVTGSSSIGGFVGGLYNTTFISSYYDRETSGQSDTGKGIPKISSEMKIKNTFTSWDFTNIWGLTSGFNNGYPCLRWQSDCVSTPENVIISTPSCVGSTVHLSWSDVPSAAQYKIYKDNTFLATTTATSSDISNISTSTVFSVSAISATGVESATSTSVSVPAGIKPTSLQISGVELVDESGGSLDTENMIPDQEFYLQGNATAENGLSQYLHMNYFSNITGVPPWDLSGSTIFTTPISSSSSTAVRGGQFSIGPFTTPSTPDDYLISYYVSAYPSCVVDYNSASTTLIMDPANSITYTIPPSASCGSADEGTSLSFPQGPAACSYGEATMTSDISLLDTGPWTWNCNDGDSTDSCSATKTQLIPDPNLNCSFLPTPATNQLNSTVVLTATTTPTCPLCKKKWTIDSKPITVSDDTSYTLNNIFTTVGLKTITAQVFSEDDLSYGSVCTATTNVIQGESITKEI